MPNDIERLTAQQTNLVRTILQDDGEYLNHAHGWHPETGQKTVAPLAPAEFDRFRARWRRAPLRCIQTMNRAISGVRPPERMARYLKAAFELEIVMDRCSGDPVQDLVGIPTYLSDGYTDLGFFPVRHRRERIVVDKERLAPHLVPSKRAAIESLPQGSISARSLESLLREHSQSLRQSVGYREKAVRSRGPDETICLSKSVENHAVQARHLAILLQLRLQEAGITSRLVKGVLHLFGLKGRHAWNVIVQDGLAALIDVTYGEEDGPLVLVGSSLAALYQEAAARNRLYAPSPDRSHHYQIRRVGGTGQSGWLPSPGASSGRG